MVATAKIINPTFYSTLFLNFSFLQNFITQTIFFCLVSGFMKLITIRIDSNLFHRLPVMKKKLIFIQLILMLKISHV